MSVTAVIIGRNEGARLRRCLDSAHKQCTRIVYVDSGSTDGSVSLAQSLGAATIALNADQPFTAARARNAGAAAALPDNPQWIQFLDGDCELSPGWIDFARRQLEARPDVAVVCGRRRERSPQSSVYNLLCDMEWDTPIGETNACGGDAMIRVSAWRQTTGFDPSLIAGEEPELCLRLRRLGWKILRVDAEMTWHDANITSFRQWWRRTMRSGHAFAEGAWLHGREVERYDVRSTASIWAWAFCLPLAITAATAAIGAPAFLLTLLYPALAWRIYSGLHHRHGARQAMLYAVFCVLGKFPQLLGQLRFCWTQFGGRRSRLIEYKAG